MANFNLPPIKRRAFLKLATAASVGVAEIAVAAPSQSIAIIVDKDSPITSSEPVAWATEKLQQALSDKGITTASAIPSSANSLVIVVAALSSKLAASFANLPRFTVPESTALIPGRINNSSAILVSGIDTLGMVYGLLELADRVEFGDDPAVSLHIGQAEVESSPNKVRSVMRAFCSEVDDKPWYYDQSFWTS